MTTCPGCGAVYYVFSGHNCTMLGSVPAWPAPQAFMPPDERDQLIRDLIAELKLYMPENCHHPYCGSRPGHSGYHRSGGMCNCHIEVIERAECMGYTAPEVAGERARAEADARRNRQQEPQTDGEARADAPK